MKKVVDARNLACPKPVINTKKALDEGGCDVLEVIVDNVAAVENVSRFATKMGYTISKTEEKGDFTHIEILVNKDANIKNDSEESEPKTYAGKNIFLNSNTLGRGSDELGKLLMEGFLYTLTQLDELPQNIVFMNSGVKLTVGESATVKNLKILEEKGVDIVVCGTCLDYFKITDQLSVGKISNMYSITEILLDKNKLVTM